MAYIRLSDFIFDCSACHTRCDGVSKGFYIFNNDVLFSERFEKMLIDRINKTGKYAAAKSREPGYPDLEIRDLTGKRYRFLERIILSHAMAFQIQNFF